MRRRPCGKAQSIAEDQVEVAGVDTHHEAQVIQIDKVIMTAYHVHRVMVIMVVVITVLAMRMISIVSMLVFM